MHHSSRARLRRTPPLWRHILARQLAPRQHRGHQKPAPIRQPPQQLERLQQLQQHLPVFGPEISPQMACQQILCEHTRPAHPLPRPLVAAQKPVEILAALSVASDPAVHLPELVIHVLRVRFANDVLDGVDDELWLHEDYALQLGAAPTLVLSVVQHRAARVQEPHRPKHLVTLHPTLARRRLQRTQRGVGLTTHRPQIRTRPFRHVLAHRLLPLGAVGLCSRASTLRSTVARHHAPLLRQPLQHRVVERHLHPHMREQLLAPHQPRQLPSQRTQALPRAVADTPTEEDARALHALLPQTMQLLHRHTRRVLTRPRPRHVLFELLHLPVMRPQLRHGRSRFLLHLLSLFQLVAFSWAAHHRLPVQNRERGVPLFAYARPSGRQLRPLHPELLNHVLLHLPQRLVHGHHLPLHLLARPPQHSRLDGHGFCAAHIICTHADSGMLGHSIVDTAPRISSSTSQHRAGHAQVRERHVHARADREPFQLHHTSAHARAAQRMHLDRP